MSTSWTAELIVKAGGVATEAAADSVPVQVRSWQHSALGDVVLTRPVRDELAEAEDLAMGATGFTPAGHVEIGHTRPRALGFPEWALVNDPANARHALAIVSDLDRVRRLAKTRANDAKILAEELYATLEKAQASYLPTFCEEVGRAYIVADNRAWAGQWFNRARLAESTYGLEIDEARHQAIFLEFAYAQALPVKSITAEAKHLVERLAPADAYAAFRQFAIERVRGGLPPYSSMTKDLTLVAKAAKVDPKQATSEICAIVLQQPSVAAAPMGWWKSVKAQVAKLVAADVTTAAQVAALKVEHEAADWIEFLDTIGILPRLPEFDNQQLLDTLDALVHSVSNSWWNAAPQMPILNQMVETVIGLLDESVEHEVVLRRTTSVDLDLLDILAGSHLTLKAQFSSRRATHHLESWYGHDDHRDLLGVAGHEMLAEEVWRSILAAEWRHFDVPGLHRIATERIGGILEVLRNEPTVVEVEEITRHFGFLSASFPEVGDTIREVDLAEALARTIRSGLRTELMWPAFEQAFSEGMTTVSDAWPELIMSADPGAAARVGYEHITELVDPAPASGDPSYSWVAAENDVARTWKLWNRTSTNWNVEYRGAWLSDPTTILEFDDFRNAHPPRGAASLGNGQGGRIYATGTVRYPGDVESAVDADNVCSDGTRYWVATHGSSREIDPKTGGAIDRESKPRFLADAEADLGPLQQFLSMYRPVPEGLTSPWFNGGVGPDGMLAIAIALQDDGGALIRTATQQRIEVAAPRLPLPLGYLLGLLRMPGADRDVVVWSGGMTDLDGRILLAERDWDPQGDDPETAPGTPYLQAYPNIPWAWNINLQPADEAGSARYRQFTAADAQILIDADGPDGGWEPTEAEIQAAYQFFEQAEASMLALFFGAGRIANRIRRWVAALDTAPEPEVVPERIEDLPGLAPAMRALGMNARGILRRHLPDSVGKALDGQLSSTDIGETFRALVGRLADEETTIPWTFNHHLWRVLIEPAAWLYRAAAEDTPQEERAALLSVVRLALDAGLIGEDVHVSHWFSAKDNDDPAPVVGARFEPSSPMVVVDVNSSWHGHSLVVVQRGERIGHPPEHILDREDTPYGTRNPDELRAVMDAITEGARIPIDPEVVDELARSVDIPKGHAAVILRSGIFDDDVKLSKELLSALGITATDVKQSVRTLGSQSSVVKRMRVAGLAGLPRGGVDVAAMAEQWTAARKHLVQLPADVGARFELELRDAREVLAWLGDTSTTEADLSTLFGGLLWLQYELPGGPQRRDLLQRAWPALRDRLATEPFTHVMLSPYYEEAKLKRVRQLLESFGEVPAGLTWEDSDRRSVLTVAPTELQDTGTALLARITEEAGAATIYHLWLRRDSLGALAEQVELGHEVADGAELRDPQVSVPEVVAEVAAALDVDEDAAALFLMVLALPDPTTKNIRAWTGWTAKKLNAAVAPLVAAEVLVESKRARAGRTFFLPGPWVALKSPHLPVEGWKAEALGLVDQRPSAMRGSLLLPLDSVPVLFTRSWQRWRDGDRPGHTGFEQG